MEYRANTAILGAGISGLCTAYQLNQSNHDCLVLESSSEAGGALKSTQSNGYLAEHGPNSLLVKDQRVNQLLHATGLHPEQGTSAQTANAAAKKRYIVHNGKPHAMPSSPLGMFKTPLFSSKGKLRFALEPFIGRYRGLEQGLGEESFADFVRRRLGPDMLASAAGPFVSGIYAGDPENLSVRHAFPRLWNLEHHYGSFILGALALQFKLGPVGKNPNRLSPSSMISFRNGMQQLPSAIAQSLPPGHFETNCQLQNIQQHGSSDWELTWTDNNKQCQQGVFNNLVLAVPHHQLAKLPLPADLLKSLSPVSSLASPPVTSLVLGFKREDVRHPLDGFGMLIKQSEASPLLGVLFSSSMFDGRAPDQHVTLTCMMGGSLNPHFAENDDQVVLDELKRLLGVEGAPSFRHRTSWQHAIPQYSLDYQKVIDAIQTCENDYPGLHLAGNYRGGISVGDCMVNGLELGQTIVSK
ncbi:protoporphyrinogen oxidase [Verrucomicrobiaceae bacterium N1E253]|uniref:Coproporphyrinogen III oxidase n=1 Tax=Oceaniferula marina TaxID=2748318 RepID=A0A851GA83_9BACT|nr:protoporphyrinogen oxidase [Oceaniferula marina]NWK54658.1 protoporphyrinogen oxidase [Oceaniferula marina]